MDSKISIETNSLKDLLSLFDKEEKINNLELGDTLHPSSGFIDETVLNGNNQIGNILQFDYDFSGLVAFKGNLKSFHLRLEETDNNNEDVLNFKVEGSENHIRLLENKIIEQNAFYPNKYKVKK